MDFEETNGIDTELVEELLPREDVEAPEEAAESLSSLTGEGESQPEGQEEQTEDTGTNGPKEPGYVQGRIAKAVDKALAEAESRFTAQLKAIEDRYAPMMERMMEMDAQELVRSGKVKDLETAKELVRYRNGQSAQQAPVQDGGQSGQQEAAPAQKEDPVIKERIRILQNQADYIRQNNGPDVIAEFRNNKEIQEKVKNGEMDFYQVAEMMKKPQRKKPPAPMRSPNGVNGQIKGTIMSMSDKQFEMLEKRVQGGERFRE